MRAIVPFAIVLCFLFDNVTNINANDTTRYKRNAAMAVLGSASDVGSFLISTALDIVSLASDDSQHGEILEKFDLVIAKIDQMQEGISLNHAQLTTIFHRLLKLQYGISIAESEREIRHCFDNLKIFVDNPSSQQSINDLKSCESIMKYVKEIAKILSGQTVGLSDEGLFDILIREQGHCNGTEITGIMSHLKELLFQGCSSVVTAETLIYGNSSSNYQKYCAMAFNETDEYAEKLYNKCSQEDCDIVLTSMNSILLNADSARKASKLLSDQFPWFYNTVIETVKCRQECFQENLKPLTRPLSFNLHTIQGKNNTFLVLYLDQRYQKDETGDAKGFKIPRSCLLGFENDLDISVFDLESFDSISIYMFQNSSAEFSAKICKGRKTTCSSPSNIGSTISEKTLYVIITIFVLISSMLSL